MATQLTGLSKKVFDDRYALKDRDGKQTEFAPEETWERVGKAIAAVEATPQKREHWAGEFTKVLSGFQFVPGGRILSGAGSGVPVTFYNCFVIPSPDDSRGGILDSVKLMVEIMSRSGGVGVNLSSLRPRGAYVRGVNGSASGAVSFGGLYSYATGLITQGGSRRGALMLMLNDDHPDIEEFITVKRTMGLVTNANLSVCISDRFMEAVKENADWDLRWGGKVYKTLKAKALWDLICDSAWASGEPGTFFVERANKRSNTWYFEKLISTNPCVTGDTRVATNDGLIRIDELAASSRPLRAVLDTRMDAAHADAPVECAFRTGRKRVYRLETSEGYTVRLTADHRVRTTRGFIPASELRKDDAILIRNRKGGFGTTGDATTGRLIGWYVGDGHYNTSKKALVYSFFGSEKRELTPMFSRAINAVVATRKTAWATQRAYDPVHAVAIDERDEERVSSRRLAQIFGTMGIDLAGEKLRVPEVVFRGNEDMQRGFLAALFTADGQVSGSLEKGVSVRLTSISRELLQDVQQVLLNFCIPSTIYENRRMEQRRTMPDGRGGMRAYTCAAQHDLVIAKSALRTFAGSVGFLTNEKQSRLEALIVQYRRGPYASTFTARFSGLVPLGIEDVYDLTEPITHSFVANGLVVHNCGEQPLGPWSVCNLGSLNVAAFAIDHGIDQPAEFDWERFRWAARTATRFLDNVIDATYYPYEENRTAQMGIRRQGLGFMGLGDLLIRMHVRYGSTEGVELTRQLYRTMRDESYRASVEIAKEKGTFPKFDREKYLEGWFIQRLPEDIREGIREHGIRNAVLLTQAPTGTTSLFAGVTSGIEPVYDFVFIRKDRIGEHEVYHPRYRQWLDTHPGATPPDYFVNAKQLTPEEHVRTQAAAQEFIDSSISKTVNAPETHTVADVQTLYRLGYELGCKGMAYFRENSRNEAVLSSKPNKDKDENKDTRGEAPKPMSVLEPRPRPEVMNGKTYKVGTAYGTLFVTINTDEQGQPFEVFATIGKSGGFFAEESEGICRLVSLALRTGIPAMTVIDQLKGIRGPMPSFGKRGMILSLPDAIAQVLEEHVRKPQEALALQFPTDAPTPDPQQQQALEEKNRLVLDAMTSTVTVGKSTIAEPVASLATAPVASKRSLANVGWAPECPDCAGMLQFQEGCMTCRGCGYSKCT
ncbi:hypothetical protein HY635_02160 [Candidatus Uhrbacteria bacterium]|nr:hypothetical protein [Candidatus Uhrbacteria bacterium]